MVGRLLFAVLVWALGSSAASAVIGGSEDNPARWPNTVMVYSASKNTVNSDGYICGGTLIASRWVLTAAHCLEGSRYVFVSRGQKEVASKKANWTRASVIKRYPGWNSKKVEGDLMLLKLPRSWSGAKLPLLTGAPAGSVVAIIGWGGNKIDSKGGTTGAGVFRTVQDRLASSSTCAKGKDRRIGARTICTGGKTRNMGEGDSGGPLMAKVGPYWLQVGISSFITTNKTCRFFRWFCRYGAGLGYYTDLSYYRSWILRTLAAG